LGNYQFEKIGKIVSQQKYNFLSSFHRDDFGLGQVVRVRNIFREGDDVEGSGSGCRGRGGNNLKVVENFVENYLKVIRILYVAFL
jgi:hypothetical protein